MQWEISTSCLDQETSTVTDTFMPVCIGQGSASRLTSWRSTSCWAHWARGGCCTEENLGSLVEPFRCVRKAQHVDRYTCRTPHFHMYSRCTNHTAQMHVYIGSSPSCAPKIMCYPCVMFHPAPQMTRNTCTSALSLPPLLCCSRPLLRSQTCRPRIHVSTVKIHLYGTHSFYRLGAHKDRARQNQRTHDQGDIEEIGVKSWSYSQSLIQSAYDSAKSTATPPDSDLEDEQSRGQVQ